MRNIVILIFSILFLACIVKAFTRGQTGGLREGIAAQGIVLQPISGAMVDKNLPHGDNVFRLSSPDRAKLLHFLVAQGYQQLVPSTGKQSYTWWNLPAKVFVRSEYQHIYINMSDDPQVCFYPALK